MRYFVLAAVGWLIFGAVELLTLSGSSADPNLPVVLCNGHRPTIQTGRGSQTIFGTPDRDVINTGPGHDVVFGEGGDDLICGGRGRDVLIGGPGLDTVLGGLGKDSCRGERLRGCP